MRCTYSRASVTVNSGFWSTYYLCNLHVADSSFPELKNITATWQQDKQTGQLIEWVSTISLPLNHAMCMEITNSALTYIFNSPTLAGEKNKNMLFIPNGLFHGINFSF